jgi:hypothetical protein
MAATEVSKPSPTYGVDQAPATVKEVLKDFRHESFYQNKGLLKLYAVLIPGVLFCMSFVPLRFKLSTKETAEGGSKQDTKLKKILITCL